MCRLRGRDWITLTAFIIVAGAGGYWVYSEWAGPRFEEGLRRTEADMKSNLPLRVDQNTTLVDVKYDRTHSSYWYVIDKADQFDAQEAARQVQIRVCTNADNSLSFPKIISARSDDAIHPRRAQQQRDQTVGLLDAVAHPCAVIGACAIHYSRWRTSSEFAAGAPRQRSASDPGTRSHSADQALRIPVLPGRSSCGASTGCPRKDRGG